MSFGLKFFLLLWAFGVKGQTTDTLLPLKREFRAVWVATVNNIDWPSRAGLPVEEQKKEFIEILNKARDMGLNALIVQVRPASDAYYRSRFEPWAQWLTGTQGQPPDPFYDPMKFMIEEAHARGIEFHAWLNPFRAMSKSRFVHICEQHITKTHPKWILEYGDYVMLNPGIPDARMHVLRVVADIVQRYDVDGIHFDDYFYPYPDGKSKLNDRATFTKYKGAFSDITDWRRNNIDEFIRMTAKTIRQYKPWVKFGVSPYGTWRNQRVDANGSNTLSGISSYDHLYADTRKWLAKGWIDYAAPQLYQNTRHHNSNFKILVNWWSDNAFGKHIYAGHAAYRVFSENGGWSWRDKSEMSRQIRMGRDAPFVRGSIYYSWNALRNNQGNVRDSLQQQEYPYLAIPPALDWLHVRPVSSPSLVTKENHTSGIKISWQLPDSTDTKGFAVYRYLKQDPSRSIDHAKNLVGIVYGQNHCVDRGAFDTTFFDYQVTSIDRAGNESLPRSTIDMPILPPKPSKPEPTAAELLTQKEEDQRHDAIIFFLDLAKENIELHFPKVKK